MATVTLITFDAAQVQAYLRQLPEALAIKATIRALNKAAVNVRTASVAAVRKHRALSARAIRDGITIERASKVKLYSQLKVSGRPVSLKEYGARKGARGVSVLVTPGRRKLVHHHGNTAFIADSIGGHVFAREGQARLPIRKLFGPSLPSTFTQDAVRRVWTDKAAEAMVKRMAEEVRFELLRKAAPV